METATHVTKYLFSHSDPGPNYYFHDTVDPVPAPSSAINFFQLIQQVTTNSELRECLLSHLCTTDTFNCYKFYAMPQYIVIPFRAPILFAKCRDIVTTKE